MDGLTLDDVSPLVRYWQKWPPAHVILANVHMKRERRHETVVSASDRNVRPANDSSEAELIACGVMRIDPRLRQHA